MRRNIKTTHPNFRFMTFKITTGNVGTTPTINVGTGDLSAITDGSANATAVLTYKEPFGTNGSFALCQAGADVAAGGFGCVNQAATLTGCAIETRNATGTLDPATSYVMVGGYEDSVMETWGAPRENLYLAKSTQHFTRVIGFKVVSNAITEGKFQGTLNTSHVTGIYTITLNNAFSCAYPRAFATPVNADARRAIITETSPSTVTVKTYNAGSLADANFDLLVVGADTIDETSRIRSAIWTPQRGTRVLGGGLNTSTDYSSTSFTDYSYTSASSVSTITFGDAFKRAPVVVCNGVGTNLAQLTAAASTTGCSIGTFNPNGGAAADAIAYFVALGFDETDEY